MNNYLLTKWQNTAQKLTIIPFGPIGAGSTNLKGKSI